MTLSFLFVSNMPYTKGFSSSNWKLWIRLACSVGQVALTCFLTVKENQTVFCPSACSPLLWLLVITLIPATWNKYHKRGKTHCMPKLPSASLFVLGKCRHIVSGFAIQLGQMVCGYKDLVGILIKVWKKNYNGVPTSKCARDALWTTETNVGLCLL